MWEAQNRLEYLEAAVDRYIRDPDIDYVVQNTKPFHATDPVPTEVDRAMYIDDPGFHGELHELTNFPKRIGFRRGN